MSVSCFNAAGLAEHLATQNPAVDFTVVTDHISAECFDHLVKGSGTFHVGRVPEFVSVDVVGAQRAQRFCDSRFARSNAAGKTNNQCTVPIGVSGNTIRLATRIRPRL